MAAVLVFSLKGSTSSDSSEIFQAQDAATTSAWKPAERTGRRMAPTATCGTPTRRTGLTLRTTAGRKEVTWPLSPLVPPGTSSGREGTEEA